jgi:pyruvyltransferase
MLEPTSSEERPELAPLRASYFQRVRNIGDAVAPYLLENLTGRLTILARATALPSARSTELPYVLSIGSLIQTSTRQSFVWGTGLIHPSAGIGDPDPARILAVRGKLTYAELVRNRISVGDVPLGDPGILVPRLLPQRGAPAPRFRLGLVPYVFDRDHPLFLAATRDSSVKVLDVCDPVDVFLAELASCDAIASSSLHGLVFGEALGLPTLWLEVSDKVVGGRFKFADWFSLARNPQREPASPDGSLTVAEIISRCEPRQIEIEKPALVQALTAEVVEACSRRPQSRAPMVPVSACRRRPLPIFILSCNNSERLDRAVSAFRGSNSRVEIIVCDNGSDDPRTLALLDELEHDCVTVYRSASIDPLDRLEWTNNLVRSFFQDWSEPSRYAVTDCIADLSAIGSGALDLYDDLLDRFPRADSVGPAITDLSPDAARFEKVVNAKRAPHVKGESGPDDIVPYRCLVVEGGLDSGFAIYRAGKPLLATMKSLRVCEPS